MEVRAGAQAYVGLKRACYGLSGAEEEVQNRGWVGAAEEQTGRGAGQG